MGKRGSPQTWPEVEAFAGGWPGFVGIHEQNWEGGGWARAYFRAAPDAAAFRVAACGAGLNVGRDKPLVHAASSQGDQAALAQERGSSIA